MIFLPSEVHILLEEKVFEKFHFGAHNVISEDDHLLSLKENFLGQLCSTKWRSNPAPGTLKLSIHMNDLKIATLLYSL